MKPASPFAGRSGGVDRLASLVIGLFFGFSLQLLFMGLIGEYVGAIHSQLQKRPWAIERERINFEHEPGAPKVQT